MPFIPHTDEDVAGMLAAIGAEGIEDLFDEIPTALRADLSGRGLNEVPEAMGEYEVARLMQARAAQDGRSACYLGAGAYEHHIPAAVWQLVGRGEFYSAYTPYQAEASQGTLQLLYEYQSMMTRLTAMDMSNASLYDGASALGEAILMSVRVKQIPRVLVPKTVHPHYLSTVHAILKNQGIEVVELPYDTGAGRVVPEMLAPGNPPGNSLTASALVIPFPNFFGALEDVDALTDWAHAQGMLVIGCVNPVAQALLKPPGEWGATGADIAIGDGQPLGVPLASGGPYFGFMTCRKDFVRQMPGRIAGRTVDKDGKPGFTLTLQAREQHIRRAKATSNICTNQGLLVTAATIHMALLGPEGLRRVAAASHANTRALTDRLVQVPGVERVFTGCVFHEQVIRLPVPAHDFLRAMAAQGILAGLDLGPYYPELGHAILVCVTETKTAEDLDRYVEHFTRIVTKRRLDPPCAQKVGAEAAKAI